MGWASRERVEALRRRIAEEMQANVDGFRVVASPYRICPLGAHVDHQGGDVTAMALDRGVLLGFVRSTTSAVRVRSKQFPGEEVRFRVGDELEKQQDWGDYARGAAMALASRGHPIRWGILGYVDGCDGMHACGVSSSAAIGVAFLLALEHANGLGLSEVENVELDRVIENGFLGLRNGVLDPSAILLSRRGCLTLIHCKDRSFELVPSRNISGNPSFKILLAFSGLQHSLSSKPGFNQRVQECQDAARALLAEAGRDDAIPILGSLRAEEFAAYGSKLGANLAKRAKHFFTEVARVEAGAKAWAAGDMVAFGKLVTQSGRSSIENYECGCEELVQLWAIVCEAPGVLGARFSGAGFRGCVLGIVEAERARVAAAAVAEKYKRAQPLLWKQIVGDPVVVCEPGDAAAVLHHKP